MHILGKFGFTLLAAGLSTAALAAPDSRRGAAATELPAPQLKLNTPVAPPAVQTPPAARGRWTRGGWSDDAVGTPVASPPIADAVPLPEARRDDGPWQQNRPRYEVPQRTAGAWAAAPRGDWRRQTWDGGRGDAYTYRRGARLPAVFASPLYVVPDWGGYDLAPPPPGTNWVRYYDDAVLVDADGRVLDSVPGIGWDAPDRWNDSGPDFAGDGPDPRREEIYGSDTGAVGTQTYRGPNGATTVIVRTAPQVTTTVVEETITYPASRANPVRRRTR